VKYLRKVLGLSQEAFGHRLGVSWVSISRWENERPISKHLMHLLDELASQKEVRIPQLRRDSVDKILDEKTKK